MSMVVISLRILDERITEKSREEAIKERRLDQLQNIVPFNCLNQIICLGIVSMGLFRSQGSSSRFWMREVKWTLERGVHKPYQTTVSDFYFRQHWLTGEHLSQGQCIDRTTCHNDRHEPSCVSYLYGRTLYGSLWRLSRLKAEFISVKDLGDDDVMREHIKAMTKWLLSNWIQFPFRIVKDRLHCWPTAFCSLQRSNGVSQLVHLMHAENSIYRHRFDRFKERLYSTHLIPSFSSLPIMSIWL